MSVHSRTGNQIKFYIQWKNGNFEVIKKLLTRTSKVAFFYNVGSGSITYLSAAFSHLWQKTRESVIANPAILLDTVHPEDREYLVKEYRELLDGTPKQGIEFRILLPDESVTWLLLTPQFATDGEGNRTVAGLAEDITAAKDNIGIPRCYHDVLFEKFTLARREGLQGEPPTGLGMSIIKTIVEWHKGSFWFGSEENVGTAFFIQIPRE